MERVLSARGARALPLLLPHLVLMVLLASAGCAATDRPVIAVVSQPYDEEDASKGSFIAAYYATFLESAGARVVPLVYDQPDAALQRLLGAVNGVLFTGGGLSLAAGTRYFQTAEKIFAAATKLWDTQREPLPLWGTCMGFQLLCILASGGNHSVLVEHAFDSIDVAWPLVFTAAADTSFLFADVPASARGAAQDVRDAAARLNVTFNWHHDGVEPAAWDANDALAQRLAVLTTNTDRQGRPFVSTVEGRGGRPLYGTQWHPERPGFCWGAGEHAPHTEEAIAVGNWMARRFVARARESSHSFGSASVPVIEQHPLVRDSNIKFVFAFPPSHSTR